MAWKCPTKKLPTAGQNICCEHLLWMEPILSVNLSQALLISAHICAIQTSDRWDKQALFSARVCCELLCLTVHLLWCRISQVSHHVYSQFIIFAVILPGYSSAKGCLLLCGVHMRGLSSPKGHKMWKSDLGSCSGWTDSHFPLMPERQDS